MSSGQYLWAAFCRLGPRNEDGGPVAYTEIWHFAQIDETEFDTRDLRILRRMSEAYVQGYQLGREAFAYPPEE